MRGGASLGASAKPGWFVLAGLMEDGIGRATKRQVTLRFRRVREGIEESERRHSGQDVRDSRDRQGTARRLLAQAGRRGRREGRVERPMSFVRWGWRRIVGLLEREGVVVARYSREQRRRAVELYERYGHSAADVIRELGYPSREALRMWHRDWLEERRTGVPLGRGERYSRYTDGQKHAAVEHCPAHGRRSGRTMRRMGYPSHEVLAAWTGRAGPGERAVKRGPVADKVFLFNCLLRFGGGDVLLDSGVLVL